LALREEPRLAQRVAATAIRRHRGTVSVAMADDARTAIRDRISPTIGWALGSLSGS
jgi:hypothetical protein